MDISIVNIILYNALLQNISSDRIAILYHEATFDDKQSREQKN